jgi:thiol-disulfide isomerase/thioredoxin
VDYNFIVSGQINNAPDSVFVRLYKALPTGQEIIDSVKIDDQGRFSLKAKTHGKDFFILNFAGQNYNIYLLADSADKIYVTADYNDILNTYQVEGSADSRLIQELEQHLAKTRKQIDSLAYIYTELEADGLQDSAAKIDSAIKQVMNAQKQFSMNFVREHYNSLVALPALSQVYVPGKGIFDPLDDWQLYVMVDTALGRLYPHNPHVLRMHSFVMNIKAALKRQQTHSFKVRPGIKAPGFKAVDLNGDTVDLAQFEGKYVYIVFWGLWCKTCPKVLNQALELSKEPKLQILTVCLVPDRNHDRNQLDSFLVNNSQFKKLTIIPDYKLWNSQIVKSYEVVKLPTTFLLSPDKKIILINADASQVREQLHYAY